jgi:cysteine desulfurase
LAILGAARRFKGKGRHIITSSVEHPAVLQCCEYLAQQEGFELTCLAVNPEGLVSPDSLSAAIRPDTVLVSVMAANNEIGTIQPVAELGAICRQRGVVFHTDAVQWFGKEPFEDVRQFNADLVSVCGHKIHGPKGAGALYIKSPLQPISLLLGGSHENERRAGTENLASIVGLVDAMERFIRPPVFAREGLAHLTNRLLRLIDSLPGARFVGSRKQRLANTVSFVVPASDSITLLAGLDLEGICASSGSACSAGSLEPSHVVRALGLQPEAANALVRFSLGRDSTLAEVEHVERVLPDVIRRASS